MNPPSSRFARRVLVMDPGSRCIKILLASRRSDAVEFLHPRSIDLAGDKAHAPGGMDKIVGSLLEEFGNVPIAISLPQQLSISQVIELPRVEPEQIKAFIQQEIAKFTGLSQSRIVYDYGRLEPFGKYQNPYWVTFAKEEQILSGASRLAGIGERLCEIITPANALVAMYQSLPSQTDNAVLVELGATSTVVTVIVQRQAAYAIHYPMGTDAFSEIIAAEKESSLDAARALQFKEDLLNGESGNVKLRSTVDAWRLELEKILRDWLRENPELNLSANSFRVLLSGGGARQPGLLKYLRSNSYLRFMEWPNFTADKNLPLDRYAVACGVALKTLGVSLPSASLFPNDLREARKRRHAQNVLQNVTWMLLLSVAFLLLVGTAQKLSLAAKKKALLAESQAILQEAKGVEALQRQWAEAYEQLRPVLKEQKRTIDTLATLAQLQQVRGDKKFWYVLFADQRSYFAGQTVPPPPPAVSEFTVLTNPAPVGKNGFIAELSLAEEGEAMRQTLSKVVSGLKNNPAFTNVDMLSSDQRKFLVNTNVIVPDRHFALSIELAETTFENPLPGPPPNLEKRNGKTNPRVFRSPFVRTSPFSSEKK